MKTFVVTVIANQILETCEVFEDVDAAFDFAKKLATTKFDPAYCKEQWSDDMRGWIIGETDKYFVSIVERNMIERDPYPLYGSHKYLGVWRFDDYYSMFDKYAASLKIPLTDLPIKAPSIPPSSQLGVTGAIGPIATGPGQQGLSDHLRNTAPATIVIQEDDDPKLATLPGGFSYDGFKPLFMKDILDAKGYPFAAVRFKELSEAQLTALLQARLNKRPNFQVLIPGLGRYIQKYALEEVKNKTAGGAKIMELLKSELYDIYYEAQLADIGDTGTEDEDVHGYFD